ncbi:MAG: acyl-CoA thioesterase [Bacteroidetes bacterium]|nr:MAG: acyl-CoA thioesterase [Bacteroidota bacterium]
MIHTVINKSVSYSKTYITELMLPSYANVEGRIPSGILLGIMDKAAFTCASRHTGFYCVTASIDYLEFLTAVDAGEIVHVIAAINYVGNTSLVVGMRVESENIRSRVSKHICTSYFSMVAKDERGKTQQVPGLILETSEEVRRFMEAMIRKQSNLKSKIAFEQKINELDIYQNLDQLKKERCEVALDLMK